MNALSIENKTLAHARKCGRGFGCGPCPPSTDDIAKAMARRDGARIIPAEAWAQYQLGLTQQVPMNVIFLTNGPTRTIVTEAGLSN